MTGSILECGKEKVQAEVWLHKNSIKPTISLSRDRVRHPETINNALLRAERLSKSQRLRGSPALGADMVQMGQEELQLKPGKAVHTGNHRI